MCPKHAREAPTHGYRAHPFAISQVKAPEIIEGSASRCTATKHIHESIIVSCTVGKSVCDSANIVKNM